VKQNNRTIYARLFAFARPYWGRIALSMLASVGVAGSDALVAKLVEPFIDRIVVQGDFALAKLVPFFVVALAGFKGFSRYVQSYFIKTAGQLAVQDIRNSIFKHLLSLSIRFYTKNSTGKLMSRILNDVNLVQSTLSNVVVTLVKESLTLVALVTVAFYTDWKMALMAFVAIPLTVYPASRIGKRIKYISKRGQGAMAILSGTLEQAFSGIKIVKSFSREINEIDRFECQNKKYYNYSKKTVKYSALSAPIVELISSAGAAVALWYGLQRVMTGQMTQGQLFSILTAISLMYTPLKSLVKVNNIVQSALGAAERIFDVLDEAPDIIEKSPAVELSNVKGEIQFKGVSFSYEDKKVLENFSCEISPGEVVALVGPSGAGKTTLFALLARFYDPQSGCVVVDGNDVRDVTQKSLHDHLAMVDQESFLFDATVAENIAYGRDGVSTDEIISAAKLAHAHDFICSLSDGYETIIGNRGVRLSGGQRQRLCIARAILQDAPILLLDEATSALDTESETKVQKALSNLVNGKTTIVIAHRLSTIIDSDKIFVLDNGKLIQSGSHHELLQQGGLYKRLYDMQFSEQSSS